ncbi:MAG: hypothetical protein JXA22_05770 [Candidatus Thermoplasmatota archaeon]|nr:hypothetical protein [Candidatus Thermoplasmatota archaeon]
MIGRGARVTIHLITGIFLVLFLTFLTIFMLGFFGAEALRDVSVFFVDETIGWILIMITGLIALIFSVLWVAFWMMDMKWKDLRYKMVFFLYHSKVSNNERIPLEYLARVGVCGVDEITKTLENMIARGELRGIVDRDEGVYIHKCLTRRGMKILMALPPAGVSGLKEVKKWALKEHTWEDEAEYVELEELEEVEEVGPYDHMTLKKDHNRVKCPHCGRMNVSEHQFCTFCGEVM